jgi:hypothetical protein
VPTIWTEASEKFYCANVLMVNAKGEQLCAGQLPPKKSVADAPILGANVRGDQLGALKKRATEIARLPNYLGSGQSFWIAGRGGLAVSADREEVSPRPLQPLGVHKLRSTGVAL